jgi:hypothetical protein
MPVHECAVANSCQLCGALLGWILNIGCSNAFPLSVPAAMQPRNVHVNAATDVVENITFMHCPPERTVKVDVPIEVGRPLLVTQCPPA